ncbi:MAG: hypothetical protein ACE5O2_16645, partial [Armatimonadota bacterium]
GVAPKDGMYDGLTERFEFTTTKMSPGEQTIHLRVRDAAGNWGTEDITVKVEGEKETEQVEAQAEGTQQRKQQPEPEGRARATK